MVVVFGSSRIRQVFVVVVVMTTINLLSSNAVLIFAVLDE